MPLNEKERKAKRAMKKTYGEKKGEEVFYKSINKGNFGEAAKQRHRKRRQNTKRSR